MTTLIERVQISQAIDRWWMPKLTPSEYMVVRHVYDRTIAWDRDSYALSLREAHKGRGNYTGGTGLAKTTLRKVLRALVAMGVLRQQQGRGGKFAYTLNLDWCTGGPDGPEHSDEGDTMALPTSRANRAPKAASGGTVLAPRKRAGGTDIGPHITKRSPSKGSQYEASPLPAPKKPQAERQRSTASEVMAKSAVRAEAAEKRDEQARREGKVPAMQDVWEAAMREAWPEDPCMSWSPKARGLWKHAVRNKTFRDVHPAEFIKWCVSEWALVRNTTLAWMKDCPVVPTPEVVMIQLYKLVPAFVTRATTQRELELVGMDRLRAKFTRQGLRGDAAEAAAEEETKRKNMRPKEEVEALELELARERAARAKEQALARNRYNDGRKSLDLSAFDE